MNKMTNSVWLIAMLSLVFGCTEQKPHISDATPPSTNTPQKASIGKTFSTDTGTPDIYTQAADETCICMQPMIDKALLLKKYQADNQTTDAKRIATEMAEIHPKIQQCSDQIRERYSQKQSKIDEKRMLRTLIERCPNVEILLSYLEKR